MPNVCSEHGVSKVSLGESKKLTLLLLLVVVMVVVVLAYTSNMNYVRIGASAYECEPSVIAVGRG